MPLTNPKTVFSLIFVSSLALLGFGYVLDYYLQLEPCPLCMTQRLTFMALITMSFIGLFIGKACKQKVILILISLLSLFGAAIAGRQIWLQMLPPHLAPSCGPDFSYLVELFPAKDIAKAMLIGDGNCAEIVWTFLGVSIPGWSFIWFITFLSVSILAVFKKRT